MQSSPPPFFGQLVTLTDVEHYGAPGVVLKVIAPDTVKVALDSEEVITTSLQFCQPRVSMHVWAARVLSAARMSCTAECDATSARSVCAGDGPVVASVTAAGINGCANAALGRVYARGCSRAGLHVCSLRQHHRRVSALTTLIAQVPAAPTQAASAAAGDAPAAQGTQAVHAGDAPPAVQVTHMSTRVGCDVATTRLYVYVLALHVHSQISPFRLRRCRRNRRTLRQRAQVTRPQRSERKQATQGSRRQHRWAIRCRV
jgi:hypothetical protein